LFHPVVATHIVTGTQVGVVAAHTRGYVAASPGVGGHVAMGPSPRSMNIPAHAVPAPPQNHTGLAQARNFGRPSTAVGMGAHPPATMHNPGAVAHNGPVSRPPTSQYHAPATQYHAPATQYHAPTSQYHPPASHYSTPQYHSPGPTYHSPSPSYHAPAPTYHPPAQSAPHSYSGGGGRSYRGGGGGRRR
jgi:hypothetical protein